MLTKHSWAEVRADIAVVNPSLAAVIDQMNPGSEYSLYKLKCPWGQHLLQGGKLLLPNQASKWVEIDDPSIDSKIADDLNYNNNMPLGVVIKKSIELYINVLGRVIPWVFITEGNLFGLWVSLQPVATTNHTGKISNIVSGSRSALFLPKISDATSFRKLKKTFSLQCRIPVDLTDQWPLLQELVKHPEFPGHWESEVIYFSKKWLEPNSSIAWRAFKNHLLEIAWNATSYLRNQVIFDIAFSCALEEKNLKPNPYLTDTVKHLYALGQKSFPGYRIARDNHVVPLDALQKIFIDVYGIKYLPNMIVPGYLTNDPMNPIYYSLEVPTLMSFSPKSRKTASKLGDLREVRHIMQRTVDYLVEDKLRLHETPLYKLVNDIDFSYFHTDLDMYNETEKTIDLLKLDDNLIFEQDKYRDKEFCDTSPFLRGCVKIAKK